MDRLGSTVPYRTQSEPLQQHFWNAWSLFFFFFFSISKPPHGEWHNASEEWRERSAIRDRDSCELQPLFQKRGLIAMTEPPQPRAPTTTLSPATQSHSVLTHTHTDAFRNCSPPVSSTYCTSVRREDLARRKMAALAPSHPFFPVSLFFFF